MLKAGLGILSGNGAAALLLLVRNLAVAALIPVGDFGIAATFAIVMAVVEMASELGLHQQIIQSDKGEDPRFQAALQGFQAFRGVLAGAVLFLMAGPIARFMGVGEATGAYQLLALVPVMNGFQHFDMHRLTRSMQFAPLMLSRGVPALISLVVVWPLAAALGDYRVMLWALMAQAVVMLVMSHLVATRPYKLVLAWAEVRESLAFGWPLLLNGILLFAVFQGDKIIVGRAMGMEMLAILAMGYTLTLTPTLVVSRSVQNFFLPQLSRRDGAFPQLGQVVQELVLLLSLVFLAVLMAFGPALITLVLGTDYAALVPLLVWLGVLQSLRLARAGCAVIALACGATALTLWGNLLRVASLPVAWWAAQQGADLLHLVWIGIFGEVLGYMLVLFLVHRCAELPIVWRPQIVAGGVMVAGIVTALVLPTWAVAAVFCIGSVLAGYLMPTVWVSLRGNPK